MTWHYIITVCVRKTALEKLFATILTTNLNVNILKLKIVGRNESNCLFLMPENSLLLFPSAHILRLMKTLWIYPSEIHKDKEYSCHLRNLVQGHFGGFTSLLLTICINCNWYVVPQKSWTRQVKHRKPLFSYHRLELGYELVKWLTQSNPSLQ